MSGISTTSISRRYGRGMPTPQPSRESVFHMAVDGFMTLVVCDFIVIESIALYTFAVLLYMCAFYNK